MKKMSREERRRQRALHEASRPKKPPTDREIIDARGKGYFACNDLLTETALKASLPRHLHPLDAMEEGCSWCGVERRIFAKGHMASLRPAPAWWKRFIAEARADHRTPRQWTDLKVTRSDGRWWIVRLKEPLDLHEPGRGDAAYTVEPWGGGMGCSAKDFLRLNLRRLAGTDEDP